MPLVYNSSGYDSVTSLNELDGIIRVYLPDLRYASNAWASKFSHVNDYVPHARAAIKEMYRQGGDLIVDESGVAQKGLIVRHLILPNNIAGSKESLRWLAAEVSPTVSVSLMSQYYPSHKARRSRVLGRTITEEEYEEVLQILDDVGLENGWVQEMGAAGNYLPNFEKEGHPFSMDADARA